MVIPPKNVRLIAASDVKTFFHESLASAMANQHLHAREDTVAYVVNMLAGFTRTDRLYEWAQGSYSIRPLALLFGEAVEARTAKHRQHALRRLGDVALFIAGLFADSLKRKVVDVEYYVSMGGTAYGCLSEAIRSSNATDAGGAVFEELSENFTGFVAALEEVGDNTRITDDADVIHWYDTWARTGSKRAARILRRYGIHILEQPEGRPRH